MSERIQRNPFNPRADYAQFAALMVGGRADNPEDRQRGVAALYELWRAGRIDDAPLIVRCLLPEDLPKPPTEVPYAI